MFIKSKKVIKPTQKETITNLKQEKKSLKANKHNVRKENKKKAKNAFRFGAIIRTKSKTSIQTVPYVKIHNQNIVELLNGRYSKTYTFTDINYTSAREDDQLAIFSEYCKFLNSLASDIIIQPSIVTKTIPMEEVYKSVISEEANEFIDPIFEINLKEEYNKVIKNYLDQGVNNHVTQKYISVSIEAENVKSAYNSFINIESTLIKKFKDISKDCRLQEVKKEELAQILAQILRGTNIPKRIFTKQDFNRKEEKAYIAPDDFQFFDNYFTMGGRFAKCMFLRDIPSHMTDELISSLISTHIEQVISINIKPVDMSKGRTKILQKQTALREAQLSKQLKSARKGIFVDTTPQPILDNLEAAEEFHDLVRSKKQNIFLFNLIVMIIADTEEELLIKENTLQSKAGELSCMFGNLRFQQERAMQTCLPICFNNLSIKRALPTECVSIFTPFDRLNTVQKGGLFYSLHADTKQAIVLNHNKSKNFSGFILGSSGSGKGMFFKQMVLNKLFLTNDDIIIVDPENENSRFIKTFGGQNIELSSTSEDYINPFDIPPEDDDLLGGTAPAQLKIDLILAIIEAMIGGEVNPSITSTVDAVLTEVYKNFNLSHDPKDIPTFKEFYDVLASENTPIAKELLDVLRIYVTGSWSNFSNKTNIDVDNRLICYNTHRLGERLKPVGSFMMFDAIWNRVAKNRNTGKNTWVFIDEVHLVFNSEDGIKRVNNMYRRIRKYDGKIISSTQNTSDVLQYQEARSMVANSDFIVVMNQKETERREIITLLNIPPALVSNITNSGAGEGIIFNENMLIPFSALFPKNTRLYELMTTNPKELAAIIAKEEEAINKKGLTI